MPGFIDVTGWTSEEVRRLGHADDYDDPTKYQPRGKTWQPQAKPVGMKHSVDMVWGAAVAANRINDGYFKEDVWMPNATPPYIAKQANKTMVKKWLSGVDLTEVTPEDIAQGQECRRFLQQDITFRALKGRLTDFDSAVSKVIAVEDEFDTAKHRYELAVVASLPASYQRALERQATQERVRQTSGALIGKPGDKVTLNVEVIKSNYSQQWNTWYATAITQDNSAVFFAYRAELPRGADHIITIQGTVKAHRDGQTQLNRVSIL